MIVEYIRYSVDEVRHSQFVEAYKLGSVPLLRSQFCRSFEICRSVEEPSKYTVRIEWTSIEDHLEGFRKSQEFKLFFAFIKPYIGDIEEMSHYTKL